MKTTSFIIAALLFSSGLLLAQNEKKPVKVRIKKVENINGVQKTTDTTFTTSEWDTLQAIPKGMQMARIQKSDKPGEKELFILEDISMDSMQDLKELEWVTETLNKDLEGLNEKAGKGASTKVIIVDSELEEPDAENTKHSPKNYTKVIVIKKIEVLDPSKEELKQIGKMDNTAKAELEIQELNLAPNPSNGHTEISLVLPKKGNTTISVYSIDGKKIYEEKLNDFTGKYHKQLDLSANPKGIYFLNVRQNHESITKKLIVQ